MAKKETDQEKLLKISKEAEKKIEKETGKDKEPEMEVDEFKVSVTHHTQEISGKPFSYVARTGLMKMHDEKGKHKSHIFFISYEKTLSDKEKETRPITFAFNGGPGSASIWVHFAALGPKRVKMTYDGDFSQPPYEFNDNDYTWLDFTDLVFIDPVGTGFSGHTEEEDPKHYYGVHEDIASVGEFIRLYITKQKRWLSPKFIAGESYGTTRAAGLAGHCQEKLGIDLNGIILISSVLDFATIRPCPHNDLPIALAVPSMAATAWYHKKLPPRLMENLEATLRETEEWVLNVYMPALAQGNALSQDKYDEIARQLAEYTGLKESYVRQANLRVTNMRYVKEFLRDERRTVGRLDTRFKGIDGDAAGEFIEYDPSLATGSFVAAVNDFIRRELKYENDRNYKFSNSDCGKLWNWKPEDGMGYACVADILRSAIHQNKYLQVLVPSGYFDIGTPYFAMKYSIDHMKLDPSLRDNIRMTYYIAGHMVYYPWEMLIKFTSDVKNFIESASHQEYAP